MYNGVEGKPTYMYDVISTSLTFAESSYHVNISWTVFKRKNYDKANLYNTF